MLGQAAAHQARADTDRELVRGRQLLALVLATLLAMAAALYVSPVGDAYSELLTDAWASAWFWVESLL